MRTDIIIIFFWKVPAYIWYSFKNTNDDASCYLIDRFSNNPLCFCNWFLRASYVMAPLDSLSASSNNAIVRSSTWSSENCIPFSSIHARITCCNSRCCIRPSPGQQKISSSDLLPLLFFISSILQLRFPRTNIPIIFQSFKRSIFHLCLSFFLF